jgi:hypothetical protein
MGKVLLSDLFSTVERWQCRRPVGGMPRFEAFSATAIEEIREQEMK